MGSSFYEQNKMLRNKVDLNNNGNGDCVKNSLEKYLAESQDEDLLFSRDIFVEHKIGSVVQPDDYSYDFFGETLSKKSSSTSTRSRRGKKKKNDSTSSRKQQRGDNEELDAALSKLFESSLEKLIFYDDPVKQKESEQIPGSDLNRRNKSSSKQRRGSTRTGPSRRRPTRTRSRTLSPAKSGANSTRIRTRTRSPATSYATSTQARARTRSPAKSYATSTHARTRTRSPAKSYATSTQARARTHSPAKSYATSTEYRARTRSPAKRYTNSTLSRVRTQSPASSTLFQVRSQSPASSTLYRVRSQSPTKSYRSSTRSRARSQSPHNSYTNANTTTTQSPVRRRTRSDIGRRTGLKNNTAQSEINQLSIGLSTLDRQVRTDRMKKKYRSPRGEGSVASNQSHARRAYNRSGLEGGGLNAIVGRRGGRRRNSVSHSGSENASVSFASASFADASYNSAPVGESFFRERKAQQESILDVAIREKWLNEMKTEQEKKRREKERIAVGQYSSDEEFDSKKKKSLVKKMKRVVRNTAKLPKASVIVAANSKRTARKVGKEAVKMTKSPSLIAKRCSKGIKETLNLATSVAKGGVEATSGLTKLTKNRITTAAKKKRRRKSKRSPETSEKKIPVLDTVQPKSDDLWWDI